MNEARVGRSGISPGLGDLTPLFGEISDLKRLRVAHFPDTLSDAAFRRSWAALLSGEDPESVALSETARAVAAARLGGIDRNVLKRGGLSDAEAEEILLRSFDAFEDVVPERTARRLRAALLVGKGVGPNPAGLPGFVEALSRQPRAGCTRPGRARLVLEPPESHADHCQTVAVYAVLLCERFEAKPGEAFLAGLTHHLHNAGMPDAGFTGEMMLGERLPAVVASFTEESLGQIPGQLRDVVEDILQRITDAEDPLGRAFNAADVMDRVIQMKHYAREAAFTLDQALGEMDLVHDGPVKEFQESVLAASGLSTTEGAGA
ncbi:hypothetical protein [Rubrobacter indicoceani]|uniref:hypothetical protein n=1 Tax=Rubrobacter indicoceani TaxID=2051957 RepID=UPI000E5BD682|nr:hypothetical protein [Rubrobacter indicoceani]